MLQETELAAILAATTTRAERAAAAAEAIRRAGGFDWVGIYDVTPATIAAIAWTGAEAPAFPTFPRTRGLNGQAVATGQVVIANDVASHPAYLTTFAATGAEMIVPVLDGGRVAGTIDVESRRPGAFGQPQRDLVTRAAALLLPLWHLWRAPG